jgi:hypothetical protein
MQDGWPSHHFPRLRRTPRFASLALGILAEFSGLQFTILLGGRHPDVSHHRHDRLIAYGSSGSWVLRQAIPQISSLTKRSSVSVLLVIASLATKEFVGVYLGFAEGAVSAILAYCRMNNLRALNGSGGSNPTTPPTRTSRNREFNEIGFFVLSLELRNTCS